MTQFDLIDCIITIILLLIICTICKIGTDTFNDIFNGLFIMFIVFIVINTLNDPINMLNNVKIVSVVFVNTLFKNSCYYVIVILYILHKIKLNIINTLFDECKSALITFIKLLIISVRYCLIMMAFMLLFNVFVNFTTNLYYNQFYINTKIFDLYTE